MTDYTHTEFFFDGLPDEGEAESVREERRRKQGIWLRTMGVRGWNAACEEAGVTDTIVARWRRTDPQFRAAAAQVNAETADRLERIADAIATGEMDGTPTQLQALQFRLRGLRPDVYRERSSVTVDATTRMAADGDGGRARLLLAEWTTPQSIPTLPTSYPRGQIVDNLGTARALPKGGGDDRGGADDATAAAERGGA